MAFFKFRKDGDESTSAVSATESVEAMRKRAKHRLIGASLLVLLGVVGFPMLFDNQPRPIPVDLPIVIPDKNTVKPLGNLPVGDAAPAMIEEKELPTPPALAPAVAAKPAVVAPVVAPASAPVPMPAASRAASGVLQSAVPVSKPLIKPIDKPAEKPAEKAPVPKPTPAKPEVSKIEAPKPDPAKDGAKALALLEGKETFVPTSPPAAPAVAGAPVAGRYVVQVGAFSDAGKAREIRLKLEAAGLKTYTQVVDTKEGKRTRVRIGPFESKADSDKAAAKVKKLDLPAAILEL